MGDAEDTRPRNKVARLIEAYELGEFGAELESKWLGRDGERTSLRDLAETFNKRLLERAMVQKGMSTVENDVDTLYRNLTDEDVSSGVRTDTRNRLERRGIAVDELASDFVTYQAIRSYLQDWRGASYDGLSDEEKIRKDIDSIQRLMTRTTSVAEDRIEKLQRTGRLDGDGFEVLIGLEVLCQGCGTQYDVTEFIEQGGCDCQNDT
ncbi:MAG: rod-determining factor RdfA [Halapricum sp.]